MMVSTQGSWQNIGPGAFRSAAGSGVVVMTDEDVGWLDHHAAESPLGRARICAHSADTSQVHEMLIVLSRDGYVRPHRHRQKSESFHVLAGDIDVVRFSDDGAVTAVVSLTPFGAGGAFYYRFEDEGFHTVLVRTETAIIHETTTGPFRREDTDAAAWAPDPADDGAVAAYQQTLLTTVEQWKRNSTL